MPPESNWKTQAVRPERKSSYVGSSSSGRWSMSTATPRRSRTAATVASRMSSVMRPRKSILSSPIFSTAVMSNWVVISSRFVRYSGRYSMIGRGAITTPAAWTPA